MCVRWSSYKDDEECVDLVFEGTLFRCLQDEFPSNIAVQLFKAFWLDDLCHVTQSKTHALFLQTLKEHKNIFWRKMYNS